MMHGGGAPVCGDRLIRDAGPFRLPASYGCADFLPSFIQPYLQQAYILSQNASFTVYVEDALPDPAHHAWRR